jgi:hypothetical protein
MFRSVFNEIVLTTITLTSSSHDALYAEATDEFEKRTKGKRAPGRALVVPTSSKRTFRTPAKSAAPDFRWDGQKQKHHRRNRIGRPPTKSNRVSLSFPLWTQDLSCVAHVLLKSGKGGDWME